MSPDYSRLLDCLCKSKNILLNYKIIWTENDQWNRPHDSRRGFRAPQSINLLCGIGDNRRPLLWQMFIKKLKKSSIFFAELIVFTIFTPE